MQKRMVRNGRQRNRRTGDKLKLESLENKVLMTADLAVVDVVDIVALTDVQSSLDEIAIIGLAEGAGSESDIGARISAPTLESAAFIEEPLVADGLDGQFAQFDELFQADSFADAIGSLADLYRLVTPGNGMLDLGAGESLDEALYGAPEDAASGIWDTMKPDGGLGGRNDAASHLRPNVGSLLNDPSSLAGKSDGKSEKSITAQDIGFQGTVHVYEKADGPSPGRRVVVKSPNADDGGGTTTMLAWDQDGRLVAFHRVRTDEDGNTVNEGSWMRDHSEWGDSMANADTALVEWSDERSGYQGRTPTPIRDLDAMDPTRMVDPGSTEGPGWAPPWQDQPDYRLKLTAVPPGARVIPSPEADSFGTPSSPSMVINPKVTVINPDPESGYQTELNPDNASQVPRENPMNRALPPDPNAP